MKNLILSLSTLVVLLSSCSSSTDDTTSIPTPLAPLVLPTHRVVTDSGTDTFSVASINVFNSNRLVQTDAVSTDPSVGTTRNVYTYTGDLITKVEIYTVDSSSVLTLTETKTYTYDSTNTLASELTVKVGDLYETQTSYITNSDGTRSFTNTRIDIANNTPTVLNTGILTFSNGNLVSREIITDNTASGGNLVDVLITNQYDTAYNGSKNILGFDKLNQLSLNNVTSSTKVTTTTPSTGGTPTVVTSLTTNAYTYTNNYPTQVVVTTDGMVTKTIQITY